MTYSGDIDLAKTEKLMESPCFKDRIRAEYAQTRIRADRLAGFIQSYQAGTLPFQPRTELYILKQQLDAMTRYYRILEQRARLEGADIQLPLDVLIYDEEEEE